MRFILSLLAILAVFVLGGLAVLQYLGIAPKDMTEARDSWANQRRRVV